MRLARWNNDARNFQLFLFLKKHVLDKILSRMSKKLSCGGKLKKKIGLFDHDWYHCIGFGTY